MIEPGHTLLLRRFLGSQLPLEQFNARYRDARVRIELVNFDGQDQVIDLRVGGRVPQQP